MVRIEKRQRMCTSYNVAGVDFKGTISIKWLKIESMTFGDFFLHFPGPGNGNVHTRAPHIMFILMRAK